MRAADRYALGIAAGLSRQRNGRNNLPMDFARRPRSNGADHRFGNAFLAAVLMAVLLLSSVGGALAFAAEHPSQVESGFPVPDSIDELNALVESGQSVEPTPATDPVAAEELPHVDLGRDEAEEL